MDSATAKVFVMVTDYSLTPTTVKQTNLGGGIKLAAVALEVEQVAHYRRFGGWFLGFGCMSKGP